MYIMFITYNPASFHLWSKENIIKHKKVSKYYEHDCKLPLVTIYKSFIRPHLDYGTIKHIQLYSTKR